MSAFSNLDSDQVVEKTPRVGVSSCFESSTFLFFSTTTVLSVIERYSNYKTNRTIIAPENVSDDREPQ